MGGIGLKTTCNGMDQERLIGALEFICLVSRQQFLTIFILYYNKHTYTYYLSFNNK